MTFVDIGAHVGYYTLLAKLKVGKEGLVVAFEPDPYYFHYLCKNLERNSIAKGVYVYQLAVSDKRSTVRFFPDRTGGCGNLYKPVNGESLIVETVSLDDFFEEWGWPRVDIIKIDVEGAEMAVLKGMRQLANRNRFLRVIAEFSVERFSGFCPGEFFEILRWLGFKKYFVITEKDITFLQETEIIKKSEREGHLNLLCEKE